MKVLGYVLCALFGYAVAWIVGKVLASREFDQLLYEEEKKKQDIINQFNDVIDEKQQEINTLKAAAAQWKNVKGTKGESNDHIDE